MTEQELNEIRERCRNARELGLTGMHMAGAVYDAYITEIPSLLEEVDNLRNSLSAKEDINQIYKNTVDLMHADIEELTDTNKALESSLYNSEMNLSHISEDNAILQARVGEMEQRAKDAEITLRDCRNQLCVECGCYREAHHGACNGCRWKE